MAGGTDNLRRIVASDSGSSAGATVQIPESALIQIQSGINALSNRLQKIEDQVMSFKSDLVRQGLYMKRPMDERSPASVSTSGASTSKTWPPTERVSISKSPGRHFVEDSTGATIFVGSHSDPPVILGCRQLSSGDILDASILDQLAPKTYPFSNIWRPDIGLSEICQALPDDADILR